MKLSIVKNQFLKSRNSKVESKKNIQEIINSSELIILCTNEKDLIKSNHLQNIDNKLKKVIDVGTNNINKEARAILLRNNTECLRMDIGNEIIEEIDSYLRNLKRKKIIPKRVKKNNKVYVSGGFIGEEGNYVVDDADAPNLIMGIIGKDGLIKKIN